MITFALLSEFSRYILFINDIATSPMAKYRAVSSRSSCVKAYIHYQNMAEDHTCKGVGECHPYREFEGMQPSR